MKPEWAVYLFWVILLMTGCEKPIVEKPRHLVSRDRMIEVLTDLHIAESVQNYQRYNTDPNKLFRESDFYYSVLHKHSLADSVFEKSLLYYASYPKEYEKIYSRVLNRLSEIDEEQKLRQQQPMDIGNRPLQ